MKNKTIVLSLILLFTLALSAFAQDTGILQPEVPNTFAQSIAAMLQPVIDGLAGKYGWIVSVLLAMTLLRFLFKPIMLALENYVKTTPSTSDDEQLSKFKSGPIYKAILFFFDLVASIKIPVVKKAIAVKAETTATK